MIENVMNGDQLIAVIIRKDFEKDGIEFFTPDEFSQQLAYMNRPAGYRIQPHVHNEVKRTLTLTLEVLFIKSGKVEVDLYADDQEFLEVKTLVGGDTILLAAGGHGFRMVEPTEIIEVKQGPYAGDQDKTRFGE